MLKTQNEKENYIFKHFHGILGDTRAYTFRQPAGDKLTIYRKKCHNNNFMTTCQTNFVKPSKMGTN
jgi:hypothetical protein